MPDNLELVADVRAELGEGPAWDAELGVLYWVDIIGQAVHAYNPRTEQNTTTVTRQMVGAVVPRESGGLIMAGRDGFSFLDLGTGETDPITDPESHLPENRFNDGKCDPAGRFFAGTMEHAETQATGALYRLDTDLSCHKILDGIYCSNGLAWSRDDQHSTLYYIDSYTRQVWAFRYDIDTGDISDKRVAVQLTEADGYPDGMTIDAEGMLWVALWGGFCVKRFDPKDGRCLREIRTPAAHTSSCCFGGDDLTDLYITTARARVDAAELRGPQQTAGGLFRISLDVPGAPTWSFGG